MNRRRAELLGRVFASGLALLLSCTAARADLSISNKPTKNMSCDAGVCTPTAKNANLNVGDLENMLASGDLTVQSGNGDQTAAGITISDGLNWINSSRLTLDAKNNIVVRAAVTVAGTGALTLTYATGNPTGDLLFENKGKVEFVNLDDNFVINGHAYELVNTIEALGAAIYSNPYGAFALSETIDASLEGHFKRSPVPTPFHGIFEGLGNSIKNLSLSNRNACNHKTLGLFKDARQGVIRDLNVVDANVSVNTEGYGCTAGILTGYGGYLKNIHTTGTISGSGSGVCMGGLAGTAVEIDDSSVGGQIFAATEVASVGGLACTADTIKNSRSTASVAGPHNGSSTAGGLADTGRIIVGSYATGDVSSGGAGGLAFYSQSVDASFSTGSVNGDSGAGGLLMKLGNSGKITNSYTLGSVTSGTTNGTGGFLGGADYTADIEGAYSVGPVSGQNDTKTGGFVGYLPLDGNILSADYWDVTTSGLDAACGTDSRDCIGIVGLSDAQLKSGLPSGFDPKIWGSNPSINSGYPYLLANPPQ